MSGSNAACDRLLWPLVILAFDALTLLSGHQEEHPASKDLSDEILALVSVLSKVQMICIQSSWCDCHPIISCFVKIQNCLTFLVPAYPGCPSISICFISIMIIMMQLCVWLIGRSESYVEWAISSQVVTQVHQRMTPTQCREAAWPSFTAESNAMIFRHVSNVHTHWLHGCTL